MKKYFILVILIIITNIFASKLNTELINEVKLANNYKKHRHSSHFLSNYTFDEHNNNFYMVIKNSDIKTSVVLKIDVYSKKITTFGKAGSKKRGGLYDPQGLTICDSLLYIRDKQINVFDLKTEKFLHAIDDPTNTLSPNFKVYNNKTIYGTTCLGIKAEIDAIGSIYSIEVDPEFTEDKILKHEKNFIPYIDYRDEMGIDLEKYLGDKIKNSSPIEKGLTEYMVSAGVFAEARYFKSNKMWAANNYGTEFFELANTNEISKTYTVNSFKKIRKYEIDNYKGNPHMWYSRLEEIFVVNNNMVLYYILSPKSAEKYKTSRLLVVKNLENLTEKQYEIEFTPVYVNTKNGIFTAVDFNNNNLKLLKFDSKKLWKKY